MKKVIFICVMLIVSAHAFAQNLNDKIKVRIEKYQDYVVEDGRYHDAFTFSITLTERVLNIRMYSFEIINARDNCSLFKIEKYNFRLQYGWACVPGGYTCVNDSESIYRSKTNQWIIVIKYVNTEDNKKYEKDLITPLDSGLNGIFLEEYNKETSGMNNIYISPKSRGRYTILGEKALGSYKGIVISEGKKYIGK
jgi:hypothetical protein